MTEPAPPEPSAGAVGGATIGAGRSGPPPITLLDGRQGAIRSSPEPSEGPAEADDLDEADTKKERSRLRSAVEWVTVVGGAVLVALVVKTFLFQAFYIPSPSMSPTLVQNDRVLVNKLAYHFHDVHRGDVVVFERPPTEPSQDIKDLIKRVVALPGERISISADRVRINGKVLDEPYVHGKPTTYSSCGLGDVKGIDTPGGLRIPNGMVFVMGDNRTDSHDGRCFGPISKKLIVGRAFLIIWPLSKVGTL